MTAAQFQTDCPADCGHPIRVGDDIETDERGDWVHQACADPFTALEDPERGSEYDDDPEDWELKPHETVCQVCFLVKPCDCWED